MNNIIIRKSRFIESLILICNSEKVYRVFWQEIEQFNGLDYNEVSNFFNCFETGLIKKRE